MPLISHIALVLLARVKEMQVWRAVEPAQRLAPPIMGLEAKFRPYLRPLDGVAPGNQCSPGFPPRRELAFT